MDLTKLTTKRLLALLKKIRKCQSCKYSGCVHGHPSIEAIKDECAQREHVK